MTGQSGTKPAVPAVSDAGRAEVLTQLARVAGLRDDFDACDRLLERAEGLAGYNLGWVYFDAGEHAQSLELFERALEVRKRDPDNRDAIAFAEEAVQTARQALG